MGARLEPETVSKTVMMFIKGEAVEFRGSPVGSFYRPQEKSYSIESWGNPGLRKSSTYLLSLFGTYSKSASIWGHFWNQLWFFQDSYSVLTRGLMEDFLKAAAAEVASGQPERWSRPLEQD